MQIRTWRDQLACQLSTVNISGRVEDAYLLWKIGGRPRQGVLYDLMRNSRLRFKHALRMCKNNKNAIIADKIADNLCNKDDRTFWREIKNVTNSKVKLPSRIGDVHGSNAVAGMWKEHYSSIFNAVSGVTVLNCMQNCVMHITNLIEACL